MKKIIIHGGKAHADDMWATTLYVIATWVRDSDYEIYRVTNITPYENDEEAVFIDIGKHFDGIRYFDHHQIEISKELAAIGLVYNTFKPILENSIPDHVLLKGLVNRVNLQDNNGPKILVSQYTSDSIITEFLFMERAFLRKFETEPKLVVELLRQFLCTHINIECPINVEHVDDIMMAAIKKYIPRFEDSIIYRADHQLGSSRLIQELDINDKREYVLKCFISSYVDKMNSEYIFGPESFRHTVVVPYEYISITEALFTTLKYTHKPQLRDILLDYFMDNYEYEIQVDVIRNKMQEYATIVDTKYGKLMIFDPDKLDIDPSIPTNIINGAQNDFINNNKIHLIIGYNNTRTNSDETYDRTLYRTWMSTDEDVRLNALDYGTLPIKHSQNFLVVFPKEVLPEDILKVLE